MAARVAAIRSKTFDLKEFQELQTAEEVLEYAKRHGLEQVGSGSSRAVFIYSSSKVLKIAQPQEDKGGHEAGIAQNKAEANVDPSLKSITTKVYAHAPDFSWIISELVRPLKEDEFKKLVGISISGLIYFATKVKDSPALFNRTLKQPELEKVDPEFFEAVVNLLGHNLVKGDIEYPDHWGKTNDGRVVMLDYGLNEEIYAKHY